MQADTAENTRAWKETLLEFAPVLDQQAAHQQNDLVGTAADTMPGDSDDPGADDADSTELDEATQLAMAMSLAAQEDSVGSVPPKPEHMSEEDYAVLTASLVQDAEASAAAAAATESEHGDAEHTLSGAPVGATPATPPSAPSPPPPCRPPRGEETAEGVPPSALLTAEAAEVGSSYSGWLVKRSAQGVFQNWRKRWVVLRGWTLLYYAKQGGAPPKGAISLQGAGVRILKPAVPDATETVAAGDTAGAGTHTFANKPSILAVTTASGRRFMFHGECDTVAEEWMEKVKAGAPVTVGDPLHIQDPELWVGSPEHALADSWNIAGFDTDSDDDEQYNDEHRAYLEYAAAREAALERELRLVDSYNGTHMAEQLQAQLQGGTSDRGRRGSIAQQAAASGQLHAGSTSVQDFVSVLGALTAETPALESPAARVQASALAAATITGMSHSDRARVIAAIQASQGLEGGVKVPPRAVDGAAVAPPLPGDSTPPSTALQHLHLTAALAAATAENQALRDTAEEQEQALLLASTQLQQAEIAAESATAKAEQLRAQNMGLCSRIAQLQVSLGSAQAHTDGLQSALATLLRPAADASRSGAEPSVGPRSASALQAALTATTGERDAFAAECMALRGQFAVQMSAWQEHLSELQGKLRAQSAEVAAARATASAWGEGQVWAHARSARLAGVREGVRRVLAGAGENTPSTATLAQDVLVAATAAVTSRKATWPEVLSAGLGGLGVDLESEHEDVRAKLAALEQDVAGSIARDISRLNTEHRVLGASGDVGSGLSRTDEAPAPATVEGGVDEDDKGGSVSGSATPTCTEPVEVTLAHAAAAMPEITATVDAMQFAPPPCASKEGGLGSADAIQGGKPAVPGHEQGKSASSTVQDGSTGADAVSHSEQLVRMQAAIARLEAAAAAAAAGDVAQGGSEIDSTALRAVKEQVAKMEASVKRP